MHRPCSVWLAVAVVVTLGSLALDSGPQASAADSPLVGMWLMHAEGIQMSLEIKATGRFYRVLKTAEGVQKTPGAYKVAGNVIQFVGDGDSETIAFNFSMPDRDTLQLMAQDGTGVELKRQQAKAPAPGGGDAANAPADIRALTAAMMKDFRANLGKVRPREEAPGWPTEMGMWGSVQRPKDWHVTDKGDFYMDLADKAEVSRLKFHTLVTFEGSPSYDEMAQVVFQKATGGLTEVSVLATDAGQSLPFQSQDDTGICQLWCLRWQHPQAGRMFGTLSIIVLARPAVAMAGLKTTATWTFTCAPEAKAAATYTKTIFPMLKSMWFPKGGGGEDSDGDGVNDNRDAAPFDPNVQ